MAKNFDDLFGLEDPPPYSEIEESLYVNLLSVRTIQPNQDGDLPPSVPAKSLRQRRQHFIKRNYRVVGQGDMTIYAPHLKDTHVDEANKIRKVEIGQRQPGANEKVIMVVGATGSGKTTTINAMFNNMVGVDWKDDYRLKLIVENASANQAESQTNWITTYTIHHSNEFAVPYTLTIIDTPGFGDTAGIQRDKEITEQIRICFKTKGQKGIDHLDAVGFVAQSALPRLTPSQKYIFESVLSLFGKDVGDNIILLLTFADGQKPQVLAGIDTANLPYKKFFKFNNSALYVNNKGGEDGEKDQDDNFEEMFWNMGKKSFKVFMTELGKLQPKSLVLTKNVLDERQRLENSVEQIQFDVKIGLNKLEQLRIEHQVLDHHQADIEKNKDFTYTVNEQEIEYKDTEAGQYTTNCITCNRTCHDRCIYSNNNDKMKCVAMVKGTCTVCPRKCEWHLHRNEPHVCVITVHQVTKTAEDLKARYEKAKGEKLTAEQIIKQCQNDFKDVQLKVLETIEQARKSIQRLNEIALRPNPLSTVDYIDILIQGEKAEGKSGWKERVDQLVDVKEKAKQMQAIAKEGYDPFAAMQKQIDNEMEEHKADLSKKTSVFL